MPHSARSQRSDRRDVVRSASSPQLIQAHWVQLCSKIGERRAGSARDRAAARYVLAQFRVAGLQAVHEEAFPCVSVVKSEAEMAIGRPGKLRGVPARVLAGSPSMRGARPVETELVWVEMPEQAERLFQPSLRGKVVALVGP